MPGINLNFDYDEENGVLRKIRVKFGASRYLAVNVWNDTLWLHINDYSKAYDEEGQPDKSKL